jgi:hypothetical protein
MREEFPEFDDAGETVTCGIGRASAGLARIVVLQRNVVS